MTVSAPRPMAWDPKSPASLMLPTRNPETQDLRVDKFLADDGVGCNSYERSALMKLIAAQGEFYKKGDDNLKLLSRTYQRALSECIEGWEGDETANKDETSLEALKIVYAVTQLSDVYLLMPSSDETTDSIDPWSTPGSVTADTVRYLRFQHMSDPFEVVGDGLDEMLESSQPEQFGAPYWKLVQTLVLRGCLDDAWNLISRHSLFRRCFEKSEILDEYHALTIEQDKKGFRVLQSLLLSAPLPGGRSEWNDSGLSPDDITQEQDDNTMLLDGVYRDAYKLWDSKWYSSGEDGGPLTFNPHAAISTIKLWRSAVIDNAALHGLVRRIPQLQANVIDVLRGKFDVVAFESWSEALCAELLYLRPNLCPKDMHVRTEAIMKKQGASLATGSDSVVLSVMKGDAGRALEVLYNLGGSSGAALPATMTSLLCNLLTEAEQIPKPDVSSSFNIQTELLLSASEALLSSLSSSEPDLGVRLSTQLLLPFAKPNGDDRIIATLGETLEHHGPSTDAEARMLLDLCRGLVARKSRRVLDGCVNLILFRYQYYLSQQNFGAAVHWLLKGIELECLLYATTDGRKEERAWEIVNASGVFGTLLCSTCLTTAKLLLAGLVEDRDENSSAGQHFARAEETVESIQEDDPSQLADKISEVKLLKLVCGLAHTITDAAGDGNSAIAKNIVSCLEENGNVDDYEVVAPLAHYAMYRDLLTLGCTILNRDEARSEASFDIHGIRLLMATFLKLSCGSKEPLSDEMSTRLVLGKGLERAFVAENAKRQEYGLPKHHGQLGSAHSSKLSSYSHSDQEKIVQMMLGPSM